MFATRVAGPFPVIGSKIAQPALVGAFFGAELLLDEDADRFPPMLDERLAPALTNLLTDATGPLRVFVTPPMLHAPLGFAGICAESIGCCPIGPNLFLCSAFLARHCHRHNLSLFKNFDKKTRRGF